MEFNEDSEPRLVMVDVDGTLTKGEKRYWEEEPEPDEEVIEKVRSLYKQGNHIVIWTARSWDAARETVAWLEKHNVWYHGIRMAKGGADLYIDDKAVNVDDF